MNSLYIWDINPRNYATKQELGELQNWRSVGQEFACELEIGFTECWDYSCENKNFIIILDL